MFKQLLLGIAVSVMTMGFAFAQVDVNKADLAALDGIRGIGPKTSKGILEERKKGGDFKDWADLQKRVKGIGEKSAVKLSQAGLTVNGQPKNASDAVSKAAVKDDKPKVKTVKASAQDMKSDPKNEVKEVKKDEKKDGDKK